VTLDCPQMPVFEAFKDAESYYATLAHELTHWTRHGSRLNRDFGRKRFGDEGYAMEELVAELGSAFLSADLKLTPEAREDHAAYIGSWIKVLKNDNRAIFSAASHAQRAAERQAGQILFALDSLDRRKPHERGVAFTLARAENRPPSSATKIDVRESDRQRGPKLASFRKSPLTRTQYQIASIAAGDPQALRKTKLDLRCLPIRPSLTASRDV
jgi:hypothetical protein